MKKIKNNKGFALAEILAVTLVLMVIFTVLYSNFMPLSGEYVKAKNYNDISSQYELHYFRKLFQSYIADDESKQQLNSELEANKYILLLEKDTSKDEKSCDSLSDTNRTICMSLKDKLNPTLILTKYNISELKKKLKSDTNELLDLRTYILSLPDYKDRDNSQEVYRLIIKTNTGYGTVTFDATGNKLDKSGANSPDLDANMIPVYYDEDNDVWRKADEHNYDKEHQWYDYNNKMWANAVTVDTNLKRETIVKNKSVLIKNKSIKIKTYKSFVSGGKEVRYAKSAVKIKVKINNNGTFAFRASTDSVPNSGELTVKVSKNKEKEVYVTSNMSGTNSKNYSDQAVVNDEYIISATYSRDAASISFYQDIGMLSNFTYPSESEVTYTDSLSVGGGYLQDWTATEGTSSMKENTINVGNSYSYNESEKKYELKNIEVTSISNDLVDKYICPNAEDISCDTLYKVNEASDTIKNVDEYKMNLLSRNTYLKAPLGTEIKMSDINTMWVWIPRYTYTYLYTSTPEEIKIKFEKETNSTGTISCTDTKSGLESSSEMCTDTTNNGLKAGKSTYTHPAFWWDKNDDEVRTPNEELRGIWVGKFEVSSDIECNVEYSTYSTQVGRGCNLQQIRPEIIPNVTSWRGAQVGTFFNGINKMNEADNNFGFTNNVDTHMMKNIEWGVVAYLSHSKYGINKEVEMNRQKDFITGCGDSYTTCAAYNTKEGKKASTTGNVYGIYDMSGGASENVMGDLMYKSRGMMSGNDRTFSWEYNSGFTGYLSSGSYLSNVYPFPQKRYYDRYSSNNGSTSSDLGKLGDATKEMKRNSNPNLNWYSDSGNFPNLSSAWFLRGGYNNMASATGLFNFSSSSGSTDKDETSRATLIVFKKV